MSPTSGGGTGTPVSGAAGGSSDLAQPFPHTLLSLGRYARLMGINPMHFMGGETPGLDPIVMPVGGCDDVWSKYAWQDNDKVSLYDIATLIKNAEDEIASIIGYFPGPTWIEEELHQYPRHYMRDVVGYGYDIRGRGKEIALNYGKFILPGQRVAELVGTATMAGGSLVYSDEDSDGFYETATIMVATTVTQASQLKLYHAGFDGDLEWEIRPVRSKIISGGFVTIVADSWYFINPELYEEYPTSEQGVSSIDISTVANFVTSVEVYHEYPDTTDTSAVFFWEPGQTSLVIGACPTCGTIGCTSCAYTSQNGCIVARSLNEGTVVAAPATYDDTNGVWTGASWTECIEPDFLKVHYLSGDQSQEFLQGRSSDPLSQYWAQAIAWIATARLERPLCSCGNIQTVAEELRVDLTEFPSGLARFVTGDVLASPFGTKRGEVMAWRRIRKIVRQRRYSVAVI